MGRPKSEDPKVPVTYYVRRSTREFFERRAAGKKKTLPEWLAETMEENRSAIEKREADPLAGKVVTRDGLGKGRVRAVRDVKQRPKVGKR